MNSRMSCRHLLAVVVLFVVACSDEGDPVGSVGNGGGEVSIQPSKDNTLYESVDGSLSNGIGEFLFSGMSNGHVLRRAVVAFDIAAQVPAGATITSVTLQMADSTPLDLGTHTSALHRLTAAWGEGTSNSAARGGGQGAAATANDATWLHAFFDATNWTTPGGDFASQASASVDISSNGAVVWASTSMLVADVQAWLDTPASNFGWILITDEATTPSARRFGSRESATQAERPTLVVEYEGAAR